MITNLRDYVTPAPDHLHDYVYQHQEAYGKHSAMTSMRSSRIHSIQHMAPYAIYLQRRFSKGSMDIIMLYYRVYLSRHQVNLVLYLYLHQVMHLYRVHTVAQRLMQP